MLTSANVIDYVNEQCGNVGASANASWKAWEQSSRNRNFAVVDPSTGRGFFIKELKVLDRESLTMMEREATVYWLAQNDADFSALQQLSPPLIKFDGKNRVIVLGWLPECEQLLNLHERLKSFPISIARGLGHSLAVLHQSVGVRMKSDPPRRAFPLQPPGILTAHRNGPLVRWLGGGQMQLIEVVLAHSTAADNLDYLASNWSSESFIHGDIKFENCLASVKEREAKLGPVDADSKDGGRSRVYLVDWELADFGDRWWDIGCVIQAYLYLCIRSAPVQRGLSLRDKLNQSNKPFKEAAEAIGSFWKEYCASAGVVHSERQPLERTIRYAAARMIQMAIEVMHGRPQPTPLAFSLLDSSFELMGEPAMAREILGIAE